MTGTVSQTTSEESRHYVHSACTMKGEWCTLHLLVPDYVSVCVSDGCCHLSDTTSGVKNDRLTLTLRPHNRRKPQGDANLEENDNDLSPHSSSRSRLVQLWVKYGPDLVQSDPLSGSTLENHVVSTHPYSSQSTPVSILYIDHNHYNVPLEALAKSLVELIFISTRHFHVCVLRC